MNILFLSDLHLDNNKHYLKKDLLAPLIAYLNKQKPDLLVLTGDVTGDAKGTIQVLDKLTNETGIPIKFVPGNHDIYTDDASSWDGYALLKDHPTSLLGKPLELPNGYVLIGGMSWYDYTFKPSFMNIEEVMMHKANLWNDAVYAKWGMTDTEVYEQQHQAIQEQLEKYQDKKIIFTNHFIPYVDFITFTNDLAWNTCNSFMGSERLGKLLDTYANVEYVVFGHTHERYGKVEFGDKTVICNPLGYVGEWNTKNIAKELEAIGVMITI